MKSPNSGAFAISLAKRKALDHLEAHDSEASEIGCQPIYSKLGAALCPGSITSTVL